MLTPDETSDDIKLNIIIFFVETFLCLQNYIRKFEPFFSVEEHSLWVLNKIRIIGKQFFFQRRTLEKFHQTNILK